MARGGELEAARVLDALHRIAVSISTAADPRAIAELVAQHARELLDADDAVLYIWDADAELLRLSNGQQTGHTVLPTMAAGQGVIGQVFVSGEPAVVTDYPSWEGALPELIERGVKRVAAVPLKIERRTVGVLGVRFRGPRGCQPSHVRALQLLAAPVAAILDAALNRHRAEQGETRLAAIVDHLPCGVIVRDASGTVVLLNRMGQALGRVGLDRLDQLEFVDGRTGRRLAADELPTARALQGQAVIDQELRVRPEQADEPLWLRISAVPLHALDGSVSGAVAIFNDVSRERQLLHTLRLSASENSRLVSELQEAQRRHHNLLTSLRPEDPQSAALEEGAARLTVREREVLARLAQGETNRQIGQAIGLSAGTVKKHVEHILRKLGVADRTRAAVRASELGLADRPD